MSHCKTPLNTVCEEWEEGGEEGGGKRELKKGIGST